MDDKWTTNDDVELLSETEWFGMLFSVFLFFFFLYFVRQSDIRNGALIEIKEAKFLLHTSQNMNLDICGTITGMNGIRLRRYYFS